MKVKACAKINLTLDIVGKRCDGYHLIDSVFQSVSIFDELCVEKGDGITVKCSVGSIDNKDNIVCKAAEKFFENTKINGGAAIEIKKNIPLAAGLGGGSADAAAVIVALDRLYETKLSNEQICSIGLSVGADVPFCTVGGTARVGGIGEIVEKLPDIPDCAVFNCFYYCICGFDIRVNHKIDSVQRSVISGKCCCVILSCVGRIYIIRIISYSCNF